MTINSGAILNLLQPTLNAVFYDYDTWDGEWRKIYEVGPSDKAVEMDVEMRMSSIARLMTEGGPTPVDNGMGQRIVTTYVHKFVGLSFAITEQAMQDNQYKDSFPTFAKGLKRSLAQAKEVLGAAVLNNAFDPTVLIGDGKPLASTQHPIDGGFYANTSGIPKDFNERSLEDAINGISRFRDQAGILVQIKPKKLLAPTNLQWSVGRVLHSQFRTNTPNNDISEVNYQGAIPEGYITNHYLTDQNAWFVLTDAVEGFKHFVRQPAKTDVYTDFYTGNLLCKGIERYSNGVSNARASWCERGI